MDIQDITPQIAEVAKSYQYRQTPDLLVFLQEMITSALRFLHDFLLSFHISIPALADSRMVSNVMQFALYAAGLGALSALVAAVIFKARQIQKQGAKEKTGQLSSQLPLDARGWRQEAEVLAQRKQWRDACRALQLSLLRLLHEENIAHFAPTRTNYEYWYALSQHPEIQSSFRKLADTVEALWFGHQSAHWDDYALCLETLTRAEQDVAELILKRQERSVRSI